MTNGRPLRFLALTLGGWTTMRTVMLWQGAVAPGATLPLPTIAAAQADPAPVSVTVATMAPHITRLVPPLATPRRLAAQSVPRAPAPSPAAGPPLPDRSVRRVLSAAVPVPPEGAIPPPLRPTVLAPPRSRLAGSAWLIARGGGSTGGGTLTGGQLGASQAGARLTYALGRARRVALSARIATPLAGRGRDAAFGIDWQPTRAPIHLLAEQRVSLDGGRGGPTLIAIAGIDPVPVAAGFRLEAYGEAGAIARAQAAGGVEAFGDGAVRVVRPLARLGPVRLDAGVGGWGAFQRGVRRLDVGPTVGAVAPIAGRAVRMTLDWRARAAGNARPGSGPALSLGTDF